MALTDDLKAVQDTLSDLWASVQDEKELARNADFDTYVSVSVCVDEAQDAIDQAVELLEKTG